MLPDEQINSRVTFPCATRQSDPERNTDSLK
jgi:hypothetical protein